MIKVINKKRLLAAVVVAPLALVVGACSGGGASDNAPQTAENFLHALADKDVESVCLMMGDDDEKIVMTKESGEWEECQSYVHGLLSDSDAGELEALGNAKVESADIDGDEATVSDDDISGVVDPDIDMELILIDGKWYVSDID